MKLLISLLLLTSFGCKYRDNLTIDLSKADSIITERHGKVRIIKVYVTDTAYVNPFDEARDMPMQDDYRDSGGGNRIDSNIVIGAGEVFLNAKNCKCKNEDYNKDKDNWINQNLDGKYTVSYDEKGGYKTYTIQCKTVKIVYDFNPPIPFRNQPYWYFSAFEVNGTDQLIDSENEAGMHRICSTTYDRIKSICFKFKKQSK